MIAPKGRAGLRAGWVAVAAALALIGTGCGMAFETGAPPTPPEPSGSHWRPAPVASPAAAAAAASAASVAQNAAAAAPPEPKVLPSAYSLTITTPSTPVCDALDRVLVGGEALLGPLPGPIVERFDELAGALHELVGLLDGDPGADAGAVAFELGSVRSRVVESPTDDALREAMRDGMQGGAATPSLRVLGRAAQECGLTQSTDDVSKLATDVLRADFPIT